MAVQLHSFVRSGETPPTPRPFAEGPDGQIDLRRTFAPAEPPTPWQVLGLPPRLDLDIAAVELRVRGLIRALHPDRFHVEGPEAVADAQRHTALVNDAWRTLRDPERRVAWLLDHLGKTQTALPAALAMALFDRNEQIDEAQADPQAGAPQLAAMRTEVQGERAHLRLDLAAASARYDAAQAAGDAERAEAALAELRTLMALGPALDNLLARLG